MYNQVIMASSHEWLRFHHSKMLNIQTQVVDIRYHLQLPFHGNHHQNSIHHPNLKHEFFILFAHILVLLTLYFPFEPCLINDWLNITILLNSSNSISVYPYHDQIWYNEKELREKMTHSSFNNIKNSDRWL